MLGRVRAFERAHGRTRFAADSKKARHALVRSLDHVSGRTRRLVKRAFKGRLVSYDSRTRRAVVLYDFSSGAQMADFTRFRHDHGSRMYAASPGGGGSRRFLVIRWPIANALVTHRFDVRRLRVAVRYGRGCNLQFTVGSENRCVVRLSRSRSPRGVSLHQGKKRISGSADVSLPDQGRLEVTVDSGHFRVLLNGTRILDAKAPIRPTGSRLGIGNVAETDGHVGELRISGVLSATWLKSLEKGVGR
jgi:hypothetical protein